MSDSKPAPSETRSVLACCAVCFFLGAAATLLLGTTGFAASSITCLVLLILALFSK